MSFVFILDVSTNTGIGLAPYKLVLKSYVKLALDFHSRVSNPGVTLCDHNAVTWVFDHKSLNKRMFKVDYCHFLNCEYNKREYRTT